MAPGTHRRNDRHVFPAQCNADSKPSWTLSPTPFLLHSSQASILILEAGSCSSIPSPIPSLPAPISGPFLWEGPVSRAKVCGGATALKGGAVARSIAPVSGMWGDSVWRHHMPKAAKMVNPTPPLKKIQQSLDSQSLSTNLICTCTWLDLISIENSPPPLPPILPGHTLLHHTLTRRSHDYLPQHNMASHVPVESDITRAFSSASSSLSPPPSSSSSSGRIRTSGTVPAATSPR